MQRRYTKRNFFRRTLSLLTWAGLFSGSMVMAQSLEVDSTMAHDAFVLYEPLTLRLSLVNQGGSPFIVDDYGEHELNSFLIHLKGQEDGYLTPRNKKPFGSAMVMPKESQELQVNLMDVFSITKPGRYHAQVIVTRGEEVAATRLMMFDVVQGIEIGSVSRPLPEYDTISRKYSLLYWPRNQVEMLFLRIDETPPGRCAGLVQLGNVVRFTAPQIEFAEDGASLTVLHQSSRDLFIRTSVKTDRDGIEITDRQKLLDPNQSPMARAVLLRQAAERGESESEDGFQRRVHSTGPAEPNP